MFQKTKHSVWRSTGLCSRISPFLSYVNDTYNSKLNYLFANDINIMYADQDLKVLETTVNLELRKVFEWLTTNKLSLNIKKSNFVIFHPYQKKLNYKVNLRISDYSNTTSGVLECKDYVKYLGVILDSHLSWKFHTEFIASKISTSIGIIARLRHIVPKRTLLNIYQSLILPYISYSLVAWGQAARTHTNKILVLQKRALRLIHFAPYNCHTIPLFVSSNILPIHYLYLKSVSILMYDVHKELAPQNILSFFTRSSELHPYQTRHSVAGNFYIGSARLNHKLKSFALFGAQIWNNIPIAIRDSSKSSFKKKINELLFNILVKEDSYIVSPIQLRNFSA